MITVRDYIDMRHFSTLLKGKSMAEKKDLISREYLYNKTKPLIDKAYEHLSELDLNSVQGIMWSAILTERLA